MRIIIIAVVALLLLGGGGYFGYTQFIAKPAEAAAGDEVKKGAEKAKKAEKEDKKGGLIDLREYVELDPLILPIVDDTGVTQTVNLVVALEAKNKSAADRVRTLSPRITDAFIHDMYGTLNRHAALKGGVIQVDMIKKRLHKVTVKILGDEDLVSDVLLQVVQQRPI